MQAFASVFALIFGAQTVIMCAIYFLSGLFLPQKLAGVYEALGSVPRFFIALFLGFSPANVVMAYVFAQYPPTLTAPVTIFSIVVLQVIFAILCFNIKVSPWLVPATLAVAGSCVWVSLLLVQKPL